MKKLETVLSPALLSLTDVKNKTVVVIDILRATSSICVAFNTGVAKILPVSTPDEAKLFKDFDFLCAAERNAEKIEGFDLGNSPKEFSNPLLADRNIAFTTTNGTKAVKLSKENGANIIAIGSFLNLETLVKWLQKQNDDVILLCSGWKDKVNVEDTLFAGAVAIELKASFSISCDSTLLAMAAYTSVKDSLQEFILQSSHAKRFEKLGISTDEVSTCLQLNTAPVLPLMQGEYIINCTPQEGM